GKITDGCKIVGVVLLRLERQFATRKTNFHFANVFRAHVELACDVVYLLGVKSLTIGTHATQVEEQLALCLGRGNLDHAPVAHDIFVNFSLDPMNGKRHQAHATVRVETLDCLHQADITFLYEVGVSQAVPQV